MRISDWSSDVCSSDLLGNQAVEVEAVVCIAELRPPFAAGQRQREIAPQPIARERQLRSEEHTSELQSLMRISYAVFCLKKKKNRLEYNLYPQKNPQQQHITPKHNAANCKHNKHTE